MRKLLAIHYWPMAECDDSKEGRQIQMEKRIRQAPGNGTTSMAMLLYPALGVQHAHGGPLILHVVVTNIRPPSCSNQKPTHCATFSNCQTRKSISIVTVVMYLLECTSSVGLWRTAEAAFWAATEFCNCRGSHSVAQKHPIAWRSLFLSWSHNIQEQGKGSCQGPSKPRRQHAGCWVLGRDRESGSR
ncbi:hypothetical protein LX36DRAFT_60704 [Colletotrichum falcatum]|nr:hypothetical protein LX36DRAFT_60704 [Colletotrichum falcatum]